MSDHILEAIDGALRDCTVSGDAMRWTADEPPRLVADPDFVRSIVDAVLGQGDYAPLPCTQEQLDAVDVFWECKIAEAEAGDGWVDVHLDEIPPTSGVVWSLPSIRVGVGKRLLLSEVGSDQTTGATNVMRLTVTLREL